MATRVTETKKMFSVIAAQTELDAKKKREYYNFVRDLIQLRKRLNIDTMSMANVTELKSVIAKEMKRGGWKAADDILEALCGMSKAAAVVGDEEDQPIKPMEDVASRVDEQGEMTFNPETGALVIDVSGVDFPGLKNVVIKLRK